MHLIHNLPCRVDTLSNARDVYARKSPVEWLCGFKPCRYHFSTRVVDITPHNAILRDRRTTFRECADLNENRRDGEVATMINEPPLSITLSRRDSVGKKGHLLK